MKAALALAALVFCQFGPSWMRGLTPYWGDLSYIHHPWRALESQLLMSGRLPLWNPYVYFGMPLSATMQDAVFYPGTAPYFFFGFAEATAIFHAFHYWLAGFLTYLWLRSLRFPTLCALGGALGVCLGGVFLARRSFLNHLAVLSLAPGMLLFYRRPAALALVLSCSFLAGFPPLLISSAAAAWAVSLALSPKRRLRFAAGSVGAWFGAGALALAFSACLLLPAMELFQHSRRAAGLALEESLRFGFSAADLRLWISPLLSGAVFNPAVEWWKSCYLGFIAWIAIVAGLTKLPRAKAAVLAAFLFFTALLILGGSNPISEAIWSKSVPLRFIRYPGNLAAMALPALALLAACGFERLPKRPLWVGLAALELFLYAAGKTPQASWPLFAMAGSLTRSLQGSLGDSRYLLSPLALESEQGLGRNTPEAILDWKTRLYGLSNAPFRLRSAANFGDPLAPGPSYHVMDFLYRRASAQGAAAYFPWAGIGRLLTPGLLEDSKLLRYEGRRLWEIYAPAVPIASAYAFDFSTGLLISAEISEAALLLPAGRPLTLNRPREDRYSLVGVSDSPGWVFISEPRYPGWEAALETANGRRAAPSLPALTAFQKIEVPAGSWRLDFRYNPWTWRLGRALSLLSLMAFAAYWYNKLANV